MTRNCLYFCYPFKESPQAWRENIGMLKKWGEQFDGKRSLFVAQDEKAESLSAVIRELGEFEFDTVLVGENDPILRETVHFLPLLGTVKDCEGITWFGHTKGVAPYGGCPTERWMRACYEVTLSSPAAVEAAFSDPSVHAVGGFRMRTNFGPTVHTDTQFMFAGTYYWLRNSELFKRDWERIEMHRWGAEAYPGCQFGFEESRTLFSDGVLDLYSEKTWQRDLGPALDKWRSEQ